MIQLVVFDLDGTLVDSHRDLVDATNALVQELGAPPLPTETVTAMIGEGAAVLVMRAVTRAGISIDPRSALERFLQHYDERLLATTRPYPGVTEMLTALRADHRLAILTNKPQRASVKVLEGLALSHYFADVIGGDTQYGRKPDPAGLLALIDRAGVTPDATLLVGDSPFDLATARRAGAHACLARYGFGYRFEESDFRGDEWFIDGPRELPDRLARCAGQI